MEKVLLLFLCRQNSHYSISRGSPKSTSAVIYMFQDCNITLKTWHLLLTCWGTNIYLLHVQNTLVSSPFIVLLILTDEMELTMGYKQKR